MQSGPLNSHLSTLRFAAIALLYTESQRMPVAVLARRYL